MALENINTSSLRNSITACKNAINYNTEKQVLNTISNESIWKTNSKDNLKNAIMTLTNQRYKELEQKLDSYYKIVSNIEKYQKLYNENELYQSDKKNLKREIFKNKTTMNEENQNEVLRNERRIENQINNLNNKIDSNNQQMRAIKTQISNLI